MLKLPNSTQTRIFTKDPNRFSQDRKLAWEVYGRFGRRVALFAKESIGTDMDNDIRQWIRNYEQTENKETWVRMVTYA